MSSRLHTHCFLFLLLTGGSHAAVTAIRTDAAVEQTGIIAGRVVDAIGQPVPGVSVTTIPESGGLARRMTTGPDGTYRFEMLPGDTYRVDFETLAFDLTRRNHVRVRNYASTDADAVLHVSAICECVTIVPSNPLAVRAGEVVDDSGRPLPHARLEVVSPIRREVAYSDADGRFLVRVPIDATWPLTASDTGFPAVTQQVSGSVAEPTVFKLAYAGTTGVPDSERLSRACRCPGDLFAHSGR
jgi:Carboxypeptidase regulatory-like domain